ncbi:MAG TPA: carbohydrate ABC transporter permease [Kiritimatiellia bacterium]|nr:carbohydrate ABC transporter permease [Kiritimatiellia bacterium]
MPILHQVGRRAWSGRLLLAGMYALLAFGAVWMVYPFLLMVSGSMKSDLDIRRFDVVPRFLRDDTVLFQKFVEQRYGGQLDWFSAATGYRGRDGKPAYAFDQLEAPPAADAATLRAWNEFLDAEAPGWPAPFMQVGHAFGFKTMPELLFRYIALLRREHPGVARHQLPARLPLERWAERSYQPLSGPFAATYAAFRAELPRRYFVPTPVSGYFVTQYLVPRYGRGLEAVARINAAWETEYAALEDIRLPARAPEQPGFREDWWSYVRDTLSGRFIRLDPALRGDYQAFLRERYGDLDALRIAHGRAYAEWTEIDLPEAGVEGPLLAEREAFLAARPGPDGVSLDGPEFRWNAWLATRGEPEAAMPVFAYDAQLLREHRGAIIRDFITRNYRIVWDYLAGHGRAMRNTVIFCLLAVLTALIVNPLAAYGLSRFQPRWGYKALFLLMATMAFPAEVTQIPAFLMLRELGWLNTFAALIIPAAANGYSIFLLKGFFDSLPKELYESADIDGASELRMFFTITLPLSTPILAVIALGAFTAAYGAFMFALLVCQKESMWTLMVYIYQLQQQFGTPVIFASLVVAALPTLVVFVFCQNIILRGIVVPVEK